MDVQAAQAVDEVLLGGDLAQGGRQPAEVLDLIGELGWPAVLGNADLAVTQTADGQPLEEEADDLLRLPRAPGPCRTADHWRRLAGARVEFDAASRT